MPGRSRTLAAIRRASSLLCESGERARGQEPAEADDLAMVDAIARAAVGQAAHRTEPPPQLAEGPFD